MRLESRAVAPFFKNGFLLGCESTREAILIDPGDEAPQLLELVASERLTVKYILLTHAHVDHVSGVALAKRATGAPVGLHKDDLPLYDRAVEQGKLFGYHLEQPPAPDFFYDPAAAPITFGRHEVRVLHTPGHSPGGVCLRVGLAGQPGMELFAGDTLFANSIGRTDLPGGNLKTLLKSIRTQLFTLDDSTIVYPGHGPDTTIGDERRSNPFLQD
jgi:glyoxylase-like metal-dependent hydrolase (beta-lactamase superfamily II)